MAASHKHLSISAAEWDSFMAVLDGVCAALSVPADDASDLHAVVSSTMADCTLGEGERAPPDPGHPAPPGDSLYARLGGVYPISLFADRAVRIPLGGARAPAALKYLFTE